MTAFGPTAAGPQGEPGRDSGFRYVFEADTDATDPGSGKVKFNLDPASAPTVMYISSVDNEGTLPPLSFWDDAPTEIKGYVYLRKVGGTEDDVYAFRILSATNNTGWWTFTIGQLFQDLSADFNDGDEVVLDFTPYVGSDALTLTGGLTLSSGARVKSTSTQQLTGGTTYNDLAVTASEVHFITGTGAGAITINNIAFSWADGKELVLVSRSGLSIVLKHNTTGSGTATNNFLGASGADVTLAANQRATLVYDGASNRVIVSRSA